jgi:hypothetical protein
MKTFLGEVNALVIVNTYVTVGSKGQKSVIRRMWETDF